MILFDPDKHEYRDGDTIIRSVTQILKDTGIINDRWFNEEARDKGSAVHVLAERYAQGERRGSRARALADLEYINALARWMRDSHAYAIETEQVVTAVLCGIRYAGKFDLKAEVNGKIVMVDYKTGAKAKWHKLQIAAYSYAVNAQRAMCLYLRPDGTYIDDYLTPGELVHGLNQFKDAIRKWGEYEIRS